MRAYIVVFGVLLIALGVGGYFLTDRVSLTALIPAFVGLPVVACGFVPAARMRAAIFAAVVLAIIGLAGAVPGVLDLASVLDGTAERPAAAISRSLMAALCLVFLIASLTVVFRVRK